MKTFSNECHHRRKSVEAAIMTFAILAASAIRGMRRRDFYTQVIGLLRHHEPPKAEPEAKAPAEIPSREPSPRQCDPIREEDPKESSPETESASESDRLAAQEEDEEDIETSPLLRLSESRMRVRDAHDMTPTNRTFLVFLDLTQGL
ncbi:hypothetical protein NPIL_592451 [Nephila pilipes]|uniref:Uncharacterized protein n=1 Tax=Nephila pilipes TaxID=299642 RepID=A0A8X6QC15_NEPPI|nr:hypothetical protein NPIL_592451 [Nephila pilipes]